MDEAIDNRTAEAAADGTDTAVVLTKKSSSKNKKRKRKQVVSDNTKQREDGEAEAIKNGEAIVSLNKEDKQNAVNEGKKVKPKKRKKALKSKDKKEKEAMVQPVDNGAVAPIVKPDETKKSRRPKKKQKVDKAPIEKEGYHKIGKTMQPPDVQIDGATWLKMLNQLRAFARSDDQERTFDASLTKSERAALHLSCQRMAMKSRSSGRGDNRCITVTKRRINIKQKKENKLTCFTLSEEAKAVSLSLFTLYPPDSDSGHKMAGEFVLKSNKKKRRLDATSYFARPLMSKLEIKKKVESLVSKVASDNKLKQITEKRSKLPVASFRDAITSTIDSHQVVLISGETGCGKTTQVPQYILDHVWGKNETCKIICTQPRRISAVSVAVRISSERGEVIGDSVGYKIKLESKGGRNSSIIFCTTGVLLRVLVEHGNNSLDREASRNSDNVLGPEGITHIIVDEVHERDHFSDLLLAIIRDLLPSNPNIRLVLMSATIDAEKFSYYFNGCPVIKVPGFTHPVKTFYLEDILSILKANESNHLDCASRIVTKEDSLVSEEYRATIDDTINLAWSSNEYEPLLDLVSSEGGLNNFNFQHSSSGVTPLMVFARKGRVGELCMMLSLGADCHLQDNSGATALEWAIRENQMEAAEILKKHMDESVKNNDAENSLLDKYLATVNSELVDVVLVEKLLRKICTDSTDGAILVFLTGWDDISSSIKRLQNSSFFQDESKFLLLALHSKVPSLEQHKVFERPPPGCRKIILSTNIAESSITIDDVVYVIDSGRMKEKSYDPYNNVSTLLSSWISKASAKQREGRAGRCQPGICYHLYSKTRAASFSDFQVPAVKRMPLEALCLQVKLLDPGCKIADFLGKMLDPPVTQSILNGIKVLEELGALSPDEDLSELGQKLGSLPVHPMIGKMLFFSILLNCLDPALTLACVLSYRDPFNSHISPSEKKAAIAAKLELASSYGGHGDQLAAIAAFECWEKAREQGEGSSFCSKYFLSPSSMKMLLRIRKQLRSELFRRGFIPEDASCCSLNAQNPGIRDAVLVAGFYPKIGKMRLPENRMRAVVEIAGGQKIRLNPRSANFMLCSDQSSDRPLVVYDDITCNDWGSQITNCSVIGPLPLLLLATEIIVTPCEEDEHNKSTEPVCPGTDSDDSKVHEHDDSPLKAESIMSTPGNKVKVMVDRWLTFESTAIDVAHIYCLRERLSAATLFKIRNPLKTSSKMIGASIHAITRILSSDGQSGISSSLKYTGMLTSAASETGQSELERKSNAPHHGGEASKSADMVCSNES